MKILLVNNDYRVKGAVETVVRDTADVLLKNGHQVVILTRDSKSIKNGFDRAKAFFSGIYSFSAYRDVAALVEKERPDVVHAHNLYPLFSPSILAACRRRSVPTILTYHDYRETCPTYFHWRDGQICELCTGGHEYNCVLKNCRGSLVESAAHAVRSAVARKFHLIERNATLLMALTEFSKERLCAAGFEERRIAVVPNMTKIDAAEEPAPVGDYVGFAGRLSPEKSVETLLEAARRTGYPVKIAGDGPIREELERQAPANVKFLGALSGQSLCDFYRQARCIVVPSRWFEVSPLVILEAMGHFKPVVASRVGGLPTIIDDQRTGLLFEPGNVADLAAKIEMLWTDPARCAAMGQAARAKAIASHGAAAFYDRLLAAYQQAIALSASSN